MSRIRFLPRAPVLWVDFPREIVQEMPVFRAAEESQDDT